MQDLEKLRYWWAKSQCVDPELSAGTGSRPKTGYFFLINTVLLEHYIDEKVTKSVTKKKVVFFLRFVAFLIYFHELGLNR